MQWVQWTLTVLTIAAALLLSLGSNRPMVRTAYVLFTVGGLAWATVFLIRSDWPLFAQQMVLNVINFIGLVRWWNGGLR